MKLLKWYIVSVDIPPKVVKETKHGHSYHKVCKRRIESEGNQTLLGKIVAYLLATSCLKSSPCFTIIFIGAIFDSTSLSGIIATKTGFELVLKSESTRNLGR